MNYELIKKIVALLVKAVLPALGAWCGVSFAGCALVPVIL